MHTPEYYDADILAFFAPRPQALPLYQDLYRQMEAAFPHAAVKVQKSQVSFYGRHLFAMVSHPRRKREEGLLVSFGLGYQLESSRVAQAVEPYPGRWTHHVPVGRAEDVDGELLGWLAEAWAFSEAK